MSSPARDEPQVDLLTDRDRQFAEHVAQMTAARMLAMATSEEVSERVIETWAGRVQRIVGRAVIRAVLYLLAISLLIASIKAGLVDRLVESWTINGGHK